MQPAELVRRAIDRDRFDAVQVANRGKLDSTVQFVPVAQLEPVRASNSQLNRSDTPIFGQALQEHERWLRPQQAT